MSHSDTCIIQQFHVAGHCTLFTYCSLFGQQSICLALSFCCCLWSFIAAAELSCGISKGMSVGRWCEPFPDPSQILYEEYLLMAGVSRVPPENVLLFVFRSSANSDTDTRGLLVSKDDKGLCARGAFRHKAA